MAAPTVTPLPTPPSRQEPDTFSDRSDAFLGALPTFQSELNTLGTYVETEAADVATDAATASTAATNAAASAAAAAASAASAGAVLWVSGTSYAVGFVVYSPIDFQNYRCIQATSGTTDPSEDTTNWVALGGGGGGLTSQTATTTSTTQTAIATYVAADYTAMELTIVADDSTDRTITKLLVVHNGTTASATQYGEVNTNAA